MHSSRLKILILTLLSLIVINCRLYIPGKFAGIIIEYLGYWFVLVAVGYFVLLLSRYFRQKNLRRFIRANWIGLVIAAAGTAVTESHEPKELKVLYDEFVLSGTAMGMHYLREAVHPIRMHNISDVPEVLEVGVDKRPLLFPFALACLHDLTGYRVENVFILNGVACFFIIFIVYYLGCRYGGWRMGAACAGLWLSVPLAAQCATSGGYDVFNVLMILVFWHFGREYLNSGNALTQNLFVMSGVLLSQVRYESILSFLAVALIILVRWYRDKDAFLTWGSVLTPLHLFMPLMVNLHLVANPAFLQTLPGQAYFSFDYLEENIGKGVWYLFSFNYSLTNSTLLGLVGVLATVAFFVRAIGKWRELVQEGDRILIFGIGLFVIANFLMILCNFWGQLDDPCASRFVLPLYIFFIITCGWFFCELLKSKPFPAWGLSVIALAIVFAVPSQARYTATRMFVKARGYAWLFEKLKEPQHRNALVISHPVGPILHHYASTSLEAAEKSKWKVSESLKNNLYPEILVFEFISVDIKTGETIPYDEDGNLDMKPKKAKGEKAGLSAAFKREKIEELRLRPNLIARLSRITGVDGDDAKPPESYLQEKPPFKNVWDYNKHIYSMLP